MTKNTSPIGLPVKKLRQSVRNKLVYDRLGPTVTSRCGTICSRNEYLSDYLCMDQVFKAERDAD